MNLLQQIKEYIKAYKKEYQIQNAADSAADVTSAVKTGGRLVVLLLLAAMILLNLFTHVFSVVRYYGDGMEPALQNGETLLLQKTQHVQQGDIVAFYYNNKVLVRRVIATGGDQIAIADDGTVSVNGKTLEEPYVAVLSYGQCNVRFPYQVSNATLFVMGDNREIAMDSRLQEIGAIPVERLLGKVLIAL